MQRFCFTFEINPGTEDEYQRRHAEMWPDMAAAITESGIHNYTLFRRGLTITAYCECEPDAATAFARLAETEVNVRWGEYFGDLIARIVDEDGELIVSQEVWHQE